MDHDDNDHQNRHFLLGGEDNNNFLRPFLLPKFDLDEHLQVHLRFDGLDDSEDILGIQAQEGHNWMQDFSSGTRGIEFRASAAESCSISRQNIWSEATSTESVEMLLKSVGEDDTLKNKNSTDSISNDALNDANNDTTTSVQKDACVEKAIDADSTTMHDSGSPEVKESASVTLSQDNALCQYSGDGDHDANALKELDKSTASDVGEISIKHSDSNLSVTQSPVKTSESVLPNVLHSIDGDSQRKVPKESPVADPHLKSRVLDIHGCNLPDKGSGMTALSNLQIDNSTKIGDLDETMSSDQKSNDFKEPYSEALPSEASDVLISKEKEGQLLRAGSETVCHLDALKPLGMCSPLKVPSSSGAHVDSSDVTNVCKNSVQSKGSDGLLERIVDEVKLKNDDGALASQEGQKWLLQTSSGIVQPPSDGDGLVRSSKIGEIPANLNMEVEPLGSRNACSDSVHPKGPSELMDVVAGGMSFSSKDGKIEKIEDISVEKDKVNMPVIFSPEKVETNDDKSFDPVRADNGEEVIESSLVVTERGNSSNYCDGNDKQEPSGEIPNVSSEDEETQAVGTMECTELEVDDQMPDVRNQTVDHGVDDHIKPLETTVNEFGEDRETVNSPGSCNNAVPAIHDQMPDARNQTADHGVDDHIKPLESTVNESKEDRATAKSPGSCNNDVPATVSAIPELCNTSPSKIAGDPLCSPLQEKGLELSIGSDVDDTADDNSATKGKTIDILRQISDAPSASVVKSFQDKMSSEVKSDMAAKCSPGMEETPVSMELEEIEPSKDATGASDATNRETSKQEAPVSMELEEIEPSKDATGASDATNREMSEAQMPDSNLFPSNQNDMKLSGISKESCLPIPEDKAHVLPCSDVPSSKNQSPIDCGREGFPGRSEVSPGEILSTSGQKTTFGDSTVTPACPKTKFDDNTVTPVFSKSVTVPQSSECAVVNLTSIECNTHLSAPSNSSKNSQGGVGKQEINKGLSDQCCPISGDLHNVSKDMSSGQPTNTVECFKSSGTVSEERSSTFEVGRKIHEDSNRALFSDTPFKSGSDTLAGSGLERCDSGLPKEGNTPQEKEIVVNEMQVLGTPTKGTGKEKGRSIGSVSCSKRKYAKEPQISKKTEKGRKSALSGSLEEMQQHRPLEGCNAKLSVSSSTATSNLPDLNTAVSGASLFSQPFTDGQQVQLRAQILVYGYLIQGIPPEEACMASAFGDSDGGRNKWEGVWHSFSEKYRNQKSPIFRTPRPVSKPSDQALNYSPLQSRVASPACQTGIKSSAHFSSAMSLQSPVWNVPNQDTSHSNLSRGSLVDPNRILSPMHAYHSSHVRQHSVNGSPCPGQSPISVSLASTNHSSVPGVNTLVSTLRPGESAQLPHSREFSAPYISTPQFLPPGTFPSIGGAVTVSAIPAMQTDAVSLSPNKQTCSELKSRKKKKGNDSDTSKQMPIISQPLLESLSAGGSSKSVGLPTSVNISHRISEGLLANACPIISPTHFQIVGTGAGHSCKVILSEETCTKIEQARQQAEDAAGLASAAVRHSEDVWSQLAAQRNAGLVSDVEQKLASTAVAAAAAASVAKAAAAAAKIAANAALQAKLLTNEVLSSNKEVRTSAGSADVDVNHASHESSLANVTSSSVTKHNEATNSSCSIISVAREGVRRRVEAASAAAKRAENLDVIVKAAELAAGAVAQAGAIVAMGDPLPFTLKDILDAGPENYWKAQQSKTEKVIEANVDSGTEAAKDNANCEVQSAASPSQSLVNAHKMAQSGNAQTSNNTVGQPVQNCTGTVSVIIPDGDQRDHSLIENSDSIKEGSIVEVSSDENGLGCVWYSARIICLKDGQAHVCYNMLLADGGSGKLKAWVPLKGDGESPPRVRVAHPLTTVKPEGTRKRRREVVATHFWNIGDKVDAWIRDGWWEGVITEKSNDDETKLTVRFSADGGSSVVRSWDLRPSLVWKDGAWIEWLQLKEKKMLPQGDTPKEKRQKLGGPRVKSRAESEGPCLRKPFKNNVSIDLGKSDVHAPLHLSSKEHTFSVGKAAEEDSGPEKGKKTTLQRQGSKVVFGVPRPGKKRKFMDVSKQLVVDNREKVKEGSNSVKFPKYLMPQSSHGWKATTKGDQREKRAADLKSRTVRSVKSQTVQSRKKVADKGDFSTPKLDASRDVEISHGPFGVESLATHPDNGLNKNINLEVSLSTTRAVDDPVLVYQSRPMPETSSGNVSASDVEPEPAKKGKKLASVRSDKTVNLVDNSSKISGASEPRRSNRRIQPTSRLLEGLQSSLMISKIPSSSQDKGSKTTQRGPIAARGRVLRTRG